MSNKILVGLVLLLSPSFAHAGDSLATEMIQKIKSATVFIKVESASGVARTGTGFVFSVDGQTALIATNSHVVEPILTTSVLGKKLITRTAKVQSATVIFDSGTKNERAVKAEVISTHANHDLAVLRALEVPQPPAAIDITQKTDLVETMPVFTFGFPFGSSLGIDKRNPSITVAKANVSSIRNDKKDETVLIQIDGNLNPGNSGGPVVDSKGKLVGIAVAGLGIGIGFAIPTTELSHLLKGEIDKITLGTIGQDQTAVVNVTVKTADPYRKIKEVTFYYMPAEDWKRTSPSKLSDHPDIKKLTLKVDQQRAIGSFSTPLEPVAQEFAYQASFVDSDGNTQFTDRAFYKSIIKVSVPPSTTTSPTKPGTPKAPAFGQVPTDEELTRLVADLKSSQMNLRKTAAETLARAKPGEKRDEVVTALLPLLGDSSSFVKRPAVQAVAIWGGKDQVPALVNLLNQPDHFTRIAAIEALQDFHDPRAAEALYTCMLELGTRSKASKALEAIGSEAEKTVLKGLNDSDIFVRQETIKILRTIGTQQSVPALQIVVADTTPQNHSLVMLAEQALVAITQRNPGK